MAGDSDLGQRKIVDLDRGLFIVQYNSAEDQIAAPKVVVSPAPGHEQRIRVITHPDSDGATLWQPPTALIVEVTERASLQVMVMATRPNGSHAASVRIEPVSQGKAPARAEQAFQSPSAEIDLGAFRVLGHVAGIGDVVVAANEWIAGPTAPSRIEGVAIQWPQQPAGFDIRYAAKSGTAQGPAGNMVGNGEFAGTRGRASPVTGLIIEISGHLSRDYQLAADAIFLSSPAMRVTGKRIVLSGPTSREALVGLRLNLERIASEPAEAPAKREREPAAPRAPAPPAAAAAAKAPSTGRVRVFRSRAKQGTE